MGSSESPTVLVAVKSRHKTHTAVKNAFENNRPFRRVDNGVVVVPRQVKGYVKLIYDSGKGSITIYNP